MITEQIFLGTKQKRLMREGAPILMYHYFGSPDPKTHDPYLYASSKRLNSEIKALKKLGYSSATLSELAIACHTSNHLSQKVIITIDDGSQDFFDGGMEILNHHNFNAIQFLVADQIGGFNEWDIKHRHPAIRLMNETQIREWLAQGHEIGSHTLTHPNLSTLNEADARREILDSKKKLEDQFGIPIRHFCYPHGKFNTMIESLVGEAGYETACSTRFGVNPPEQNLKTLNRISPLSRKDLLGKILHRIYRKVL